MSAACTSNGASVRDRVVGRARIMSRLATTDKEAIGRVFGTTTRPRRDRDGTN